MNLIFFCINCLAVYMCAVIAPVYTVGQRQAGGGREVLAVSCWETTGLAFNVAFYTDKNVLTYLFIDINLNAWLCI